ncbi:MAG TPA: SRPBCC family protein [Acidimicrobiia bacterium]|nr:SRPBCC family protein [Acidimicrobiia bacterium]
MTTIVTKAHFSQPPDVVFSYVTTPSNWPKWHPSSLKVEGSGADHSALVGELVVEQFHVSGRRGEVTWRVVERDEPTYWRIEGVITGRRNGGTISYRLKPAADGGTDFDRTFTYPTPGVLFTLADWLFVRARVKSESGQALKQLGRQLDQLE